MNKNECEHEFEARGSEQVDYGFLRVDYVCAICGDRTEDFVKIK